MHVRIKCTHLYCTATKTVYLQHTDRRLATYVILEQHNQEMVTIKLAADSIRKTNNRLNETSCQPTDQHLCQIPTNVAATVFTGVNDVHSISKIRWQGDDEQLVISVCVCVCVCILVLFNLSHRVKSSTKHIKLCKRLPLLHSNKHGNSTGGSK